MKHVRTSRGSVSVTEDRGRIRLRWSFKGKRFSINHSFVSDLNLLAARKLALQIEQDMALDQFDGTLYKYGVYRDKPDDKPTGFTELFEYWVINYKQMDCEVHTNYNSTRNMIRKWGRVDAVNIVRKMNAASNQWPMFVLS